MITVGYCSKSHDKEFYDYIFNYFNGEVEIIEKLCNAENNKFISEAYNEIINESSNDIILFVHNNIKFIREENYKMRPDKAIEYIFKKNNEYGILGIGPRCEFEKEIINRDYPVCDYFYAESEYGKEEIKFFESNYRIKPYSLDVSEISIVDGFFMAVNKNRIKYLFDNNNRSFHFYDIDFCIGNFINGVKIGLIKSFLVEHFKTNDTSSAWNGYNEIKKYFLNKWGDKLPLKDFQHKIPLILMTASCRFSNLYEVAQSIHENFKNNKDVDIVWLLCLDKYNGSGDINKIIDYCENKANISVCVYECGKPNQANFGGTLYNEALKTLKERGYNNINPWVYILDDDNIICPLMANQIKDMVNVAENSGKEAIWMSMHREDGFIDTIRSYSVYGKGMNNNLGYEQGFLPADEFMPDPSQLIMKYSLIERMGFFDEGFTYDQKLWRYFYEHINEITLPEEWHPQHWYGRGNNNFYQCYHDGISDFKEAENIREEIKSNKPLSFSLVVGRNESCERFVLTKQEGVDIFNKSVKEKKYKYSILTCIFNNYESLKEVKDYRDDVEYVCVTDNPDLKSEQWKIVQCWDVMKALPLTNQFAYIRFHPFQFVSTDICITIDASEIILKDFYDDLIVPFINGGYKYGATLHYSRSDIYDEINAWKNIRGYKDGCYEKCINFLKEENYHMQGMVDGGLIIHTDTKMCHTINDMSWELCHELTIDTEVDRNFQIDLAYILNKYYTDSKEIMLIHPYIFEGSYILRLTHNGIFWIVYNSKETCPCLFYDKKVEPFMIE